MSEMCRQPRCQAQTPPAVLDNRRVYLVLSADFILTVLTCAYTWDLQFGSPLFWFVTAECTTNAERHQRAASCMD